MGRNPLARPERGENVLVVIESGQHEHPAAVCGRVADDPPRSFQPVDPRHPDVHQDDVRLAPTDPVDPRRAVVGTTDHRERWIRGEDRLQTAARELVVVDEEDPDRTVVGAGHRAGTSGL